MKDIRNYSDEAVSLRRAIHRRPEEGWTEFETEWLVVKTLRALGWTVRLGTDVVEPSAVMGRDQNKVDAAVARAREAGVPDDFIEETDGYTGVVAEWDTGRVGPVTGFRFDMDCVLVEESADAAHPAVSEGFASEIPGAMHACGHDGHTASGLALAHWITDNTDELCGRFRFIFQPAEEGARGAAPMAAAGAADGLNWFFGAHVGMYCKAGELGICRAGFFATTKTDIAFTGTPSHAGADPQKGRSALMAAAACALMLQGIPRHGEGETRIAVGRLVAGEGRNVTPVHASLEIETRGETHDINAFLNDNVRRIVEGAAAAYGVAGTITKAGEGSTLKTTAAGVDVLREAALATVDEARVRTFDKIGGSEDCTILMRRAVEGGADAAFLMYGCDHRGHHRSDFDIGDRESLPLVLSVFSKVVAKTNGRH